ncbi:MAG: o-succinylbenzoate synthase [Bacteroidales bacterium]|nr:o-succinylbenzoate synthase [Bacteroidales bacterium]
MRIEWAPYTLDFRFEARTSRESMRHKQTYFVRVTDEITGRSGVGECALFRGLSSDDVPCYEQWLDSLCADPGAPLPPSSSIRFGLETARMNAGIDMVTPTPFTDGREGIVINGLIWMGDQITMRERIDAKLAAGFRVLKLKIGGIDFDREVELLKYIRGMYSPETLEIRLDANGSFTPDNALARLGILSRYTIHSLEQPIKAGQPDAMADICRRSPVAIALDEELIGMPDADEARNLLEYISPQYIILKPALCGGLAGADIWADTAESLGIGWWATSALESDIGLYAIARWVSGRGVTMPQGLGTGRLYHNNVSSPLRLRGDRLWCDRHGKWQLPDLQWRQ